MHTHICTYFSALLHKVTEETAMWATIRMGNQDVYISTVRFPPPVRPAGDHLQPRSKRKCNLTHLRLKVRGHVGCIGTCLKRVFFCLRRKSFFVWASGQTTVETGLNPLHLMIFIDILLCIRVIICFAILVIWTPFGPNTFNNWLLTVHVYRMWSTNHNRMYVFDHSIK